MTVEKAKIEELKTKYPQGIFEGEITFTTKVEAHHREQTEGGIWGNILITNHTITSAEFHIIHHTAHRFHELLVRH